MSTTQSRDTIPADVAGVFQNIQCGCQHPDGQCTNTARLSVVHHCIHRCKEPQFEPDGNTSDFRCMPCFSSLVMQIVEHLLGLLLRGYPLECRTCHIPLRTPDDVIKDVKPL